MSNPTKSSWPAASREFRSPSAARWSTSNEWTTDRKICSTEQHGVQLYDERGPTDSRILKTMARESKHAKGTSKT